MRLDSEKQTRLEPNRIEFAKQKIEKLGYQITFETEREIKFAFKGEIVLLFPYSGWHTGKTIFDGRGISKLLKQIK